MLTWHNEAVYTTTPGDMTVELVAVAVPTIESIIYTMHYLKESVYRIQKIDQHSFLQRPLSISLFMIALSVCEIAVNTLSAKDGDLRLSASNACLPKTEISVFVTECVFFTSTCYKLHVHHCTMCYTVRKNKCSSLFWYKAILIWFSQFIMTVVQN